MAVANLNVEISARLDKLQGGLQMASKMIADFSGRVQRGSDDMQSMFKGAERGFKSIGSATQGLGDSLIMGLTGPLAALAGLSIQAAGDYENLSNAITATMTDAGRTTEQATKEVELLRQAALAPGLDFEQAVRASIRLQNVGYSAEAARKMVTELANAITMGGGTAEDLDGVTRQFSQMISKGRVLQEDLSVIAERMPKIAELSKAAFGTFNAEALRSAGVDAQEFIAGIVGEMEKLKRVEGGISNSLVNAGSAVKQFLGKIGLEINKAFNLSKLSDDFSNWLGKMGDAFSNLDPEVKKTILSVAAVAIAWGPVVKGIGLVTSGIGSLMSFLGALSNGLSATISGISAAVGWLKTLQFSMVGFLNLGGALLLLVPAVVALASAFTGLTEEQEMQNRINEKLASTQQSINDEYAREQAVVMDLFATARNYTLSTDERRGALKKLQEMYPQYIGNLDLEKMSLDELAGAQDIVLANMKEGIKQRMKQSAIMAELEKQTKAELRMQQIREQGFSALTGEEVKNAGLSLFGTDFEKKFVSEEGKKNALKNIEAFYGKVIEETKKTIEAVNSQFDKGMNAADSFYAFRDAEENFTKVEAKGASSGGGGKGKGVDSEKVKKLKEMSKAWQDVQDSIKGAEEAGKIFGDTFDRLADAYTNGIEKLTKEGFGATSKEVLELVGKVEELKTSLRGIKPHVDEDAWRQLRQEFQGLTKLDPTKDDKKKGELKPVENKLGTPPPAPNMLQPIENLSGMVDEMRTYKDILGELTLAQEEFGNGLISFTDLLSKSMQSVALGGSLMQNAFLAVGEAVYQAASSGETSMKSLGNIAVATAAKVVRSFIQQGVAAAVANALKNPVGIVPPAGIALAAGAGALAGVLFNKLLSAIKVPALAEGGVLTGPSLVLAGEYPGARANPEVIAPLDKLQGMMGGGQVVVVGGNVRFDGKQLVLALEAGQREMAKVR